MKFGRVLIILALVLIFASLLIGPSGRAYTVRVPTVVAPVQPIGPFPGVRPVPPTPAPTPDTGISVCLKIPC